MSRPRIILHIGRNKCGSTTIQQACLNSQAVLADRGIRYGHFGHLWQSRGDVPGWMTFEALAAHAHAHPESVWLVSNEFMSAWPDEFTRHGAEALAECDVSVIAYVRRYDHWICSAYAEETRVGMNCRDIDAYVRDMQPRISALPYLEQWVQAFGKEKVRVRSLHPADLIEGDLLSDFAGAIGFTDGFRPVSRQNVAPHWMELELVRRLTTRDAAEAWGGADQASVGPLAKLMGSLEYEPRTCQYLSTDRQRDLLASYADDAATLKSWGQTITPITEPSIPRPFLPSFDRIPLSVRNSFFAAAGAPAFVSDHPTAAEAAAKLATQYETDDEPR